MQFLAGIVCSSSSRRRVNPLSKSSLSAGKSPPRSSKTASKSSPNRKSPSTPLLVAMLAEFNSLLFVSRLSVSQDYASTFLCRFRISNFRLKQLNVPYKYNFSMTPLNGPFSSKCDTGDSLFRRDIEGALETSYCMVT